ncbi:MAG: alkaline phosphatase family protein, partial [Pedobacter sp.]
SWIIFFDLMRVLFLLYHVSKTKQLSFSTILGTFTHGFRMDASVAAYLLIPVCLFVLLSLVFHFFRRLLFYKIYTFVILLLVALISLADLEVYNAWGFRIDTTPLRFLGTPREAMASMGHLPIFWILLVFVICYGLFYFCFKYILRRIFFQQQNRYKLVTALVLLLFTGGLMIPIRGGFQQAPLNQSSVYFSTNNYANHAAINASWNFLHSMVSKNADGKNPYNYMSPQEAQLIVDSLYRIDSSGLQQSLNQQDSLGAYDSTAKPTLLARFDSTTNVLVIIWESFTEKALSVQVEGKEVTPRFNQLKKEGVYFSNTYASGDRTNKGIPAILSGYPAMPNTTIIHSPGKSMKLKVLTKLFRDKNYVTPFFYGGEPEFANIKSYLLHGGFDPIVGRNDFAAKDMNSKWGAHDGVVMNRVLNDLGAIRRPFFSTWLTLSSHEPFETPIPVVIKGDDITAKFLNSLNYTDGVIGEFIDKAKQSTWWKNTVIIIIGDHGHPLPSTGKRADDFRTPMLWLGGAVIDTGKVIDRTVSQLDIAAMLSAQLGWKNEYFPYSKNSLDPRVKPWAFFTFNNGFG